MENEKEMMNYWRIHRNYWRRNRMPQGRGFGRGRNRNERCGRMDGSQYGWKRGGRGRNRTEECRHPGIRDKR